MSAPAATTTRSCRSRCRSRPPPDGACWCGPARMPTISAGLLAEGLLELCRHREASVGPCHLRDRRRNGACSANAAFCSATISSSTGTMPATRPSTISSAALSARKRKAIRRERREALANGIERATGSPASRSDRSSVGTRSSRSTWIPARANGAGPTSRASSIR